MFKRFLDIHKDCPSLNLSKLQHDMQFFLNGGNIDASFDKNSTWQNMSWNNSLEKHLCLLESAVKPH